MPLGRLGVVEAQHPLGLAAHGFFLARAKRPHDVDPRLDPAPGLARVPRPGEPSIDEQRARVWAFPVGEPLTGHLVDEARPIRVSEQDVVEVSEEPDGGRQVGVRPRGVRKVEQLAATGIAEGRRAPAAAARMSH